MSTLHPFPLPRPRPAADLSRPATAAIAEHAFDAINPVTGHRATRLPAAAAGTADPATVSFEFTLPARAAGAPWHYHLRFTETFTVLAGELFTEVGARGHGRVLRAGESVTIPPGTPHRFLNASAAPAVFRCDVTPGESFDRFIRVLYGLARDGRADAQGMPHKFRHTVLVLQLGDVRLPGIPAAVQNGILAALAWCARRMGAHRELAAYLPGLPRD
jgi:mannose-6-phosphate isomerase-like protein (cupin superfamily)